MKPISRMTSDEYADYLDYLQEKEEDRRIEKYANGELEVKEKSDNEIN